MSLLWLHADINGSSIFPQSTKCRYAWDDDSIRREAISKVATARINADYAGKQAGEFGIEFRILLMAVWRA
jgi:hypothetical protein